MKSTRCPYCQNMLNDYGFGFIECINLESATNPVTHYFTLRPESIHLSIYFTELKTEYYAFHGPNITYMEIEIGDDTVLYEKLTYTLDVENIYPTIKFYMDKFNKVKAFL